MFWLELVEAGWLVGWLVGRGWLPNVGNGRKRVVAVSQSLHIATFYYPGASSHLSLCSPFSFLIFFLNWPHNSLQAALIIDRHIICSSQPSIMHFFVSNCMFVSTVQWLIQGEDVTPFLDCDNVSLNFFSNFFWLALAYVVWLSGS